MASIDTREKTHRSVLPQRCALESVSADNLGVRTKRGTEVATSNGDATAGISHGRGETVHPRHASDRGAQRHGEGAVLPDPGTGGSDLTTTEQSQESPIPVHSRVFVLDKNHQPLDPCHPARARQLLNKGRAVVVSNFPFVIRLKDRTVDDSEIEGVVVKIDPGSKHTGIAIARIDEEGVTHGLISVEVGHRGDQISNNLTKRAAYRKGRRSRNTRHREPRFNNRTKPEGWLAPSIHHRVDSAMNMLSKIRRYAPVKQVFMESVRFDTQLIQNPEISGVEYQQGELAGYEVREYLLLKYGYRCVYCDITGVPLNVDHVVPRSRHGSDRVSNLVLSCVDCNQAKGNMPVDDFVTDPRRLERIKTGLKKPLRDAAAVNSTRNALRRALEATGLPISTGTGGCTKWNRTRFRLPKSHCIDALCVGEVVGIATLSSSVLHAVSTGRGRYQRTIPDKYGFPRLQRPRRKQHYGFTTGDIVRAAVPRGKYAGKHTGRAAVRTIGKLNITTKERTVQSINHRYCELIQRADGWGYQLRKESTVLSALTGDGCGQVAQ